MLGVSLLAAVIAILERVTYQQLGQSRHSTRLVPAGEQEVADQLDDWLRDIGFTPISYPPVSVRAVDALGEPYRDYYVGSYGGSRVFFVSVKANWAPAERNQGEPVSNVLIYVVAKFRARPWEVGRTRKALAEFIEHFHQWCDTFGPVRVSPTRIPTGNTSGISGERGPS